MSEIDHVLNNLDIKECIKGYFINNCSKLKWLNCEKLHRLTLKRRKPRGASRCWQFPFFDLTHIYIGALFVINQCAVHLHFLFSTCVFYFGVFGVLKVHEMLTVEIFLKIRNADKETILSIISVACLPSSTAYLTSEPSDCSGSPSWHDYLSSRLLELVSSLRLSLFNVASLEWRHWMNSSVECVDGFNSYLLHVICTETERQVINPH